MMTAADGPAVCAMIHRSIVELCAADHRHDPVILARWLENKTPADVGRWIANPQNHLLVAEQDSLIIGAAGITSGGEITLNYVSPDARFCGVSRAMVSALEDIARSQRHAVLRVDSTETARLFYLGLGYRPSGAARSKFGMPTHPMDKALRPLKG